MPNLGWWRSWTPARTLRTHCTHTGPGRRPSSSTLCSTSTPPSKMCTCHPPALSGRRHFWIQRDGVCPRPLRCCQRPVSPGGNEVGGSGALPNSTKHLVCAGLALVPLHPLAPLVLSTALKGASKTHTMLRMDAGPGIYLQMLTDLFQAVEETRESTDCSVSMSCLETTQLLTKGNWQCTQESTATSKMSSRSHAVLQVTVHQRSHGTDMAEEVHIGRLSMVDLAGSELAPQTRNRGKRMKEGVPINRSLPALGNGINALSEKGGSQAQYVNFRDANSRAPAAGQAQPAERVLPHRTVRGRHLRPGQADQAPQGQGGEAGEGEEKHPGGRHAPGGTAPGAAGSLPAPSRHPSTRHRGGQPPADEGDPGAAHRGLQGAAGDATQPGGAGEHQPRAARGRVPLPADHGRDLAILGGAVPPGSAGSPDVTASEQKVKDTVNAGWRPHSLRVNPEYFHEHSSQS
ncbi:uncharacterized protein LOC118881463 isoform X14 [Balaenoptera musculus]|uniref:Kinesin-like protein n=1 Tax=Balaenoptera musculus TaxID=9771 RepID=A0A8B8VC05_BALMU|nr:uncharacterized protein LOC118881463 isoform X14 [Balaenoptera musculus]